MASASAALRQLSQARHAGKVVVQGSQRQVSCTADYRSLPQMSVLCCWDPNLLCLRVRAHLGNAAHAGGIAASMPAHFVLLMVQAVPAGESGTVLITGGTGALGSAVAGWLASQGVRRVLLAARSGRLSSSASELLTGSAFAAEVTIRMSDAALAADVIDLTCDSEIKVALRHQVFELDSGLHGTRCHRDEPQARSLHP